MQEITLKLSIDDVNVVLEGLGNLPFARVYAIVGRVQEQAAHQLRADPPAVPDAHGVGARPVPALA